MRHPDQKIYRTFEEFEREELRRADVTSTVSDMLSLFEEDEPDRMPGVRRKIRSPWEDDE